MTFTVLLTGLARQLAMVTRLTMRPLRQRRWTQVLSPVLLHVDVGIVSRVMSAASATPLADQIAASVRGSLGRRELATGDRLPAARELAAALDVNVHTVLRAYAALRDDGLIDLRRGRGAVVSAHVDADHTHLTDLARSFVADARRLGLDDKEMTTMLEKAIEDTLNGATS